MSNFSNNLQFLCSYEKSVSTLCRNININRQQFNKYLKGISTPSSYNLRKICNYFHIDMEEIHMNHSEFIKLKDLANNTDSDYKSTFFTKSLFSSGVKNIRKYLGDYHTYYYSPNIEGESYIMRAFSRLYEIDGMVFSKTIEYFTDPVEDAVFFAKYNGQVAYLNNRLFILEYENLVKDAIVETILFPMNRTHSKLLHGVTFGLSSKKHNPFVSRCVWKHVKESSSVKENIASLGLYKKEDLRGDKFVLSHLGEVSFPNHLLSLYA